MHEFFARNIYLPIYLPSGRTGAPKWGNFFFFFPQVGEFAIWECGSQGASGGVRPPVPGALGWL